MKLAIMLTRQKKVPAARGNVQHGASVVDSTVKDIPLFNLGY